MTYSTEKVTATKTGTGWTLDVTDCHLSSDLTKKDFRVTFDGAEVGTANFSKNTSTQIQYTGVSYPTNVEVVVRRLTQASPYVTAVYRQRINSADYDNELERIGMALSEIQYDTLSYYQELLVDDINLYAYVDAQIDIVEGKIEDEDDEERAYVDAQIASVRADYASADTTVTNNYIAADAVLAADYNGKFALKANIASPTFTGTPAAPTPPDFDETTRLATTEFVIRHANGGGVSHAELAAGDAAVTAAFIAADAVVTSAYQAADNNKMNISNPGGTGTLWIGNALSGTRYGVEIAEAANIAYIDFHTSDTFVDQDCRIYATGNIGTAGGGTMQLSGGNVNTVVTTAIGFNAPAGGTTLTNAPAAASNTTAIPTTAWCRSNLVQSGNYNSSVVAPPFYMLTGGVVGAGYGVEVGATTRLAYFDFHSGDTYVDYDVRMISSSGTGSAGGGGMTCTAATWVFTTNAGGVP